MRCARQRIWARAKRGLGWNDPSFGTRCAAKVTRGVVPAQLNGKDRVLPAAKSQNMQFVMQEVGEKKLISFPNLSQKEEGLPIGDSEALVNQ